MEEQQSKAECKGRHSIYAESSSKSIDSFIKKDLSAAQQVILDDDLVDRLYEKLINEIITLAENKQVSSAFAIYTTLVVKYIERIADHASNIAEWVIYILSGYYKDKQIF